MTRQTLINRSDAVDVPSYDDSNLEDIDTDYLALGDERTDIYIARWRKIADTVAVEDGLCSLI